MLLTFFMHFSKWLHGTGAGRVPRVRPQPVSFRRPAGTVSWVMPACSVMSTRDRLHLGVGTGTWPIRPSSIGASRTGRRAGRRLPPCRRWCARAPSRDVARVVRLLADPVPERRAETVRHGRTCIRRITAVSVISDSSPPRGAGNTRSVPAIRGSAASSDSAAPGQRDAVFLPGFHAFGRHSPHAAGGVDLGPCSAAHFAGAGGGQDPKFQRTGAPFPRPRAADHESAHVGGGQRRVMVTFATFPGAGNSCLDVPSNARGSAPLDIPVPSPSRAPTRCDRADAMRSRSGCARSVRAPQGRAAAPRPAPANPRSPGRRAARVCYPTASRVWRSSSPPHAPRCAAGSMFERPRARHRGRQRTAGTAPLFYWVNALPDGLRASRAASRAIASVTPGKPPSPISRRLPAIITRSSQLRPPVFVTWRASPHAPDEPQPRSRDLRYRHRTQFPRQLGHCALLIPTDPPTRLRCDDRA